MSSKFHVIPASALVLTTLGVLVGCQPSTDLGPVPSQAAAEKIREQLSGDSEGGGGGEAAEVGTGWATLKGRFTFEGQAPEMPAYNVTSDQATCASGGAPKQETIVVGSDGGLANVVLFLRKASRVHESAQAPEEPLVFDQKQCVFLTHVFTVPVGQPLQIKNSDPVGHNTKIDGKNGFNRTIPAGESVSFTPKKAEAKPASVACSIHPWMSAWMMPHDNGYAVVTKPDGSFELPNLPAGETLEIQVWHESSAGSNGGLVVNSDQAKELKWDKKGRFKIKLTEDETKELNVAVPASAFSGG
ncbi:cupredoxin domain-containing protein [Adhaeretor mobilis]|uniref:Methylamine utilization protein n=1 Tax=Adhaeretor mobilis TaxID=1930276 RepID=A0A517MZ51_9BACT|nr:hypothetical protein [Adhaeretor mobilis]QDT00166.1 hypothetical protein HG15A2_35010 [Adhaeretor mobilis]